MAEDVRRSAEIRRMASHKVAAELLKVEDVVVGNSVDDKGHLNWSRFVELVDKLDDDVVSAGDQAERGARVGSKPSGVDSEPPPRPRRERASEAPQNGSESPQKLSPDQAGKMAAFLVDKAPAVDGALLGLKLMSLGFNKTDSYVELADSLTVDQAKELVSWVKEQVAS